MENNEIVEGFLWAALMRQKLPEGQKEMLLPIEGKQSAGEASARKVKPSRPLREAEEVPARAVSKRRSSR